MYLSRTLSETLSVK